jgi:hypothetical protein
MDEIGTAMKEKGVTLEQWIEDGRAIREQLYQERYGKHRPVHAQALH